MVNPKVMQANAHGYGTDVSVLKNADSGPLRIADFQPGQYVEFTRFDGFFEQACLDKLRIQNIADPPARFKGLAQLGTQIALAPGTPGYNPDVKPLPYDPESAKAAAAEGRCNRAFVEIIDPPAFGGASELKSQMEAIAADLGKISISVETTLTDLAGYLGGTKDNDIAPTVYDNSGNDVGVASLYFSCPPTTYQTPADPR
jgi:ABC-type transport system substrate-binding protein